MRSNSTLLLDPPADPTPLISHSRSHRRRVPSWLANHWHLLILLLLTAIAGALRFTNLNRPPLLIDECFTFWRTCGSFGDLCETLRDDGFVPLHYELLWWIKEGLPLSGGLRLVHDGLFQTPTVMRFVPAICGTLMVPVMYFTARQLFRRGVALVAALFVACSAYATFFSRDAKMYMPAWMLLTLASGCLFWWLRTARPTAWLAWVAAGAAAAGVHVVTLLVIALAPLFLLTSRRVTWQRGLLMLAGLALITAGPAGYYLGFNRWAERSGGIVPGVTSEPAPDANWQASGLNWLGAPADGPHEAFQSLATYLSAYEWDGNGGYGWEHHVAAERIITLMCGLLVLGALPWPQRWRGNDRQLFDRDEQRPAWRGALWLGCWIVVPAYAFFYCRSYDDPASPRDWLIAVTDLWGRYWWIGLAVVSIGLAVAGSISKWAKIGLGASAAVIVLVLVGMFVIWTPETAHRLVGPDLVKIVAVLLPAAVWVYGGETTRERLLKTVQLAGCAAVILLTCTAAHAVWAGLRARSLALHPELRWQSVWHTRYIGIVWPAVWIAAAALVMRLPTLPVRALAVFLIVVPNVANGIARYAVQTQVPLDRVFADVWRAKPGATVRTYFDLNSSAFGGSGLPSGDYWKPIASYNLVLAARLQTTPVDFRTGKAWPFEYGPVVDRFAQAVAYRPTTSAREIAADIGASPEVDHVIVWEQAGMFATRPSSVLSALGSGWRVSVDEDVDAWWYWTWEKRLSFRHFELERSK